MKKILITGGAGFIGSNLTDFFLKKGDYVLSVDNFLTSSPTNVKPFLSNSRFTFKKIDLLKSDIKKFVGNQKIDIIYHLASPASPKQYIKYPLETLFVNSLSTYMLLNFIKDYSSKTIFIFASTSEVYGDPEVHPQNETYWGNVNPVGVRSCYDEAKRFGEALCMTFYRKYDIDIRIARIFNTYGPNMEKNDGRVISNFVVQALSGKPLTVYGKGTQTRSFCYVSDLVMALSLMAQKSIKGEIVNLGNNHEIPIIDIANFIKKITNSKSKVIYKILPQDDPKRRCPDIDKAKKKLQWKPIVSIEKGLPQTIQYFKERFRL